MYAKILPVTRDFHLIGFRQYMLTSNDNLGSMPSRKDDLKICLRTSPTVNSIHLCENTLRTTQQSESAISLHV